MKLLKLHMTRQQATKVVPEALTRHNTKLDNESNMLIDHLCQYGRVKDGPNKRSYTLSEAKEHARTEPNSYMQKLQYEITRLEDLNQKIASTQFSEVEVEESILSILLMILYEINHGMAYA